MIERKKIKMKLQKQKLEIFPRIAPLSTIATNSNDIKPQKKDRKLIIPPTEKSVITVFLFCPKCEAR